MGKRIKTYQVLVDANAIICEHSGNYSETKLAKNMQYNPKFNFYTTPLVRDEIERKIGYVPEPISILDPVGEEIYSIIRVGSRADRDLMQAIIRNSEGIDFDIFISIDNHIRKSGFKGVAETYDKHFKLCTLGQFYKSYERFYNINTTNKL